MDELRAYRRMSLVAALRGEDVSGYAAECRRRIERCEGLLRQFKAEGVVAMGRLKDAIGEDVFNEAARGLIAEQDEDAGGGIDGAQ